MKRRFAWLLAVLLMLALLCACAETKTASTEPYTVGSYTVTPINEKSGTITDGTNTYSYRYSTSGSGYSVTFSYPDGESYTWTENGSSGTGSASMEFDFAKYPSGMELNGVLSRTHPNVQKEKPVAVILVLRSTLRGRQARGIWRPVGSSATQSRQTQRSDGTAQAACWR